MKKPQPIYEKGRVAVFLVAGACMALLPFILLAQAPQWWSQRGVTTGNPSHDYAAANQGQVKNMATAAAAELNARLPAKAGETTGAGNAITTMVSGWQPPNALAKDYAAVNIGQLKNVAKLFYDRLAEVGYQGPPLQPGQTYPWDPVAGGPAPAPNDYALANVGQIKHLFSFDLTDFNPDDAPPISWEDWLAQNNLGSVNPGDMDQENGVTYWQDYIQGRTPNAGFVAEAAQGVGGGIVELQVFTPLQ